MKQAQNPNDPDRAGSAGAPKRRWRLSRRGFLIGIGAAGATLAVGAYFGKPALNLYMAESMANSDPAENSFMQMPNDPPLMVGGSAGQPHPSFAGQGRNGAGRPHVDCADRR